MPVDPKDSAIAYALWDANGHTEKLVHPDDVSECLRRAAAFRQWLEIRGYKVVRKRRAH